MTDKLMTDEAAAAFDNSSPATQIFDIGERVKEIQEFGLSVQRVDVTADATGGGKTFVANFNMVLLDIIVRATAAAATSTIQLRKATTAITSTITCAVDLTIGRPTTISDEDQVLVKGTTYNMFAAGTNAAAVRCEAFLIGYRI